jgi:tetratricopeptide (TPR) repeat protein
MTSPISSNTSSAATAARNTPAHGTQPEIAADGTRPEIRQVESGDPRATEASIGLGRPGSLPLAERTIESVEAPVRPASAELPAAPSAAHAALERPSSLGAFDVVGKSVLLATTGMLRPSEMVPLASTSSTVGAALGPEIVRRRWGEVLDRIGKHAELIDRFGCVEHFKDKDPGTLTADQWSLLANDLLAIGKFEDAEKAIRSALRLRPEDPRLHMCLADVLLHQGRKGDAGLAMEKPLSYRMALHGLSILQARVHLLGNEIDRAMDALRFSSHQGLQYWATRSMIEFALGDPSARESLRTAISLNLPGEGGEALIAEAAAWMGDAALALTWFDKAAGDLTVARAVLSPFTSPLRDPGPQADANFRVLSRETENILQRSKHHLDTLFAKDASGQIQSRTTTSG